MSDEQLHRGQVGIAGCRKQSSHERICGTTILQLVINHWHTLYSHLPVFNTAQNYSKLLKVNVRATK